MLSLPDFMSCFDLMQNESEQYIQSAGIIAEECHDNIRESASNPTEVICHGVILNLFSQHAKRFCQRDAELELELLYVGHAREKMTDLIEAVSPFLVDAHFYELVEEAAMEQGVSTDDPYVIGYFANRERQILGLLSEMYGYDLSVFNKTREDNSGQPDRKNLPPSTPQP